MKKPKVAFVHEYLVQYGGAEKTLEEIIDLYPEAPIYTGNYDPKLLSEKLNSRHIISPKNSFLQRFPKYLTFLMPMIFENFDLRSYDLIISDGTAWPKGVITSPDQLHISYIHTPPRFLYGYSVESDKRDKWYFKPFVGFIDHFLRIWDYHAAQRPDYLLVNSHEVQQRVHKYYRRDSEVIYPPVEINYPVTEANTSKLQQPYYLAIGRLAAYKNFDLLVEVFNMLEMPLVIIGTGKEEKKLRKLAKENITFTGKATEAEKHQYLEGCLGLINPVIEEDFGIVPVEALAHGKPVLAHRSGGALEMIQEGINGMFYDIKEFEHFSQRVREFDNEVRKGVFNKDSIKETSQKFDRDRFKRELQKFINDKLEIHALSRKEFKPEMIKSDHA